MATATDQAPWIRAALAPPPARDEDLIHQLAEALGEILAHPEVRQAEARIHAGLNRFAALDERLADKLNIDDLVQVDYYCAVVRATLSPPSWRAKRPRHDRPTTEAEIRAVVGPRVCGQRHAQPGRPAQ